MWVAEPINVMACMQSTIPYKDPKRKIESNHTLHWGPQLHKGHTSILSRQGQLTATFTRPSESRGTLRLWPVVLPFWRPAIGDPLLAKAVIARCMQLTEVHVDVSSVCLPCENETYDLKHLPRMNYNRRENKS